MSLGDICCVSSYSSGHISCRDARTLGVYLCKLSIAPAINYMASELRDVNKQLFKQYH